MVDGMLILQPRALTSVMLYAVTDDVSLTWILGEPLAKDAWGFVSYGVTTFDADGAPYRGFGVKQYADALTTAYVFDHASTSQANYDDKYIAESASTIFALYVGAALHPRQVASAAAWVNVDGDDVVTDIPVTILS